MHSLINSPYHQAPTVLYLPAQFASGNCSVTFIGSSVGRRKLRTRAAPIKEVDGSSDAGLTASSPGKAKALEIHGEMRTISYFNRFITSEVASDKFHLASELKSSLKGPTEVRAIQKSEFKLALENEIEPNATTFTSLIKVLCKNGRLNDAFQVLDVMSSIGCGPTIITFNCLLKGLCYVGRVEEAVDLMEKIKKSSMEPDIYTYTAVMDGLCKVGRSSEAFGLLKEALEMELMPTAITYNTLFNGYFKEGKPLCGFRLLRQMQAHNCKPDYIIYCTFLHGLLKWGKTKAALHIYNEMVKTGFRVDERMTNTLLRGLCRCARKKKEYLKDVYHIFEEMKNENYVIYACTYDLVIESFCNGKEMDRAFEILNEMVMLGHSPKTFTFNFAIYSLCSVGEVDKALRVLMLMNVNRKSIGIPFDLLIKELNNLGRSLDASNVYGMALKRGVAPKSKLVKYFAIQGSR